MIDGIIRLTVLAVAAVALLTVGRAGWIGLRLGRRIGVRHADLGLGLWLPIFASARDARAWLETWRAILTSDDPAIARVVLEGRVLAARYAELAATSNAWALAIAAVLPRLG